MLPLAASPYVYGMFRFWAFMVMYHASEFMAECLVSLIFGNSWPVSPRPAAQAGFSVRFLRTAHNIKKLDTLLSTLSSNSVLLQPFPLGGALKYSSVRHCIQDSSVR